MEIFQVVDSKKLGNKTKRGMTSIFKLWLLLTTETKLPAKIRKFQWAVFEQNVKTPLFLAKNGPFSNFSLFYSIFFIFQYKKSENYKARIFTEMGMYVRTDERMNGRTEVNPKVHRLRQEINSVKRPKKTYIKRKQHVMIISIWYVRTL